MNGRYLLDTNIVIAVFNNDSTVAAELDKAGEVFVPATVIGELCYGAEKSSQSRENLDRISEFAADSSILTCDVGTSFIYGRVKNYLRKHGKPIPENDIWIASLAKQHRLALVSRDNHFSHIAGLTLEKW